jgi:hypothetical protein
MIMKTGGPMRVVSGTEVATLGYALQVTLELSRKYSQYSTESLIRIATDDGSEYLPHAISIACLELSRRGVEVPQTASISEEELATLSAAYKDLTEGAVFLRQIYTVVLIGGIAAVVWGAFTRNHVGFGGFAVAVWAGMKLSTALIDQQRARTIAEKIQKHQRGAS